MKKTFTFAFVMLLVLAMISSSCQLPAPGGGPKATATTSQGQATQPPQPTNTSASQKPEVKTPEGGQPTATPLAVTATPVSPTNTPVPTEAVVPTATTAPNAVRIQFASGATASTVSGELDTGQVARYVLQASAGQTMSIDVWSPNGDVYLEVTGASDGKLFLSATAKATEWSGVLDSTQDYYLTAVAGDGRTSYSLTAVIPPLPAATEPSATAAPSGTQFDPYKTFGKPNFEDLMDTSSLLDWVKPNGDMPDTPNIRLALDGDEFLVTGKLLDFSTWWFSWRSLDNFYLEMTVDSRTCAGGDAYGLILRGPEHGAGKSYGYVVSFTCDGKLWFYRLDSALPWTATDLVSPVTNTSIASGSNMRNVIGVKADGDTLTIYANGYQVAQVVDRHFISGRYGVFVRPSSTDFYTYEVVKMAYWILDK
jgi:hypothetical protein